jgi:hypothetical protein
LFHVSHSFVIQMPPSFPWAIFFVSFWISVSAGQHE